MFCLTGSINNDLWRLSEEIDALTTEKPHKIVISKKETKSDIDLYFCAMKSAYGAYYYFGEKNFEQAKENLLEWTDQQPEEIKVNQLGQELAKEMTFVKDAHFFAFSQSTAADSFFQYYYSLQNTFEKDGNSYYTIIDGVKWYFVSFSSGEVSLEPTLTTEGRLVYAPTQWCCRRRKDRQRRTPDQSDRVRQLPFFYQI